MFPNVFLVGETKGTIRNVTFTLHKIDILRKKLYNIYSPISLLPNIKRRHNMKKVMALVMVIVTLMLALQVTATAATYVVRTPRGDGVWARNAMKNGDILGVIPDGTVLNVLRVHPYWVEIKYRGQTAYVYIEYVIPVKSSNEPEYTKPTKTTKTTRTTKPSKSIIDIEAEKWKKTKTTYYVPTPPVVRLTPKGLAVTINGQTKYYPIR